MGRNARIGLFLLMGLVVALARLVEVEVGKPKPGEEAQAAPSLLVKPPSTTPPGVHARRTTHRASEHGKHAAPKPAPTPASAPSKEAVKDASKEVRADDVEGAEWPRGPIYVVKKGETLGVIAQKTLGTSKLALKLLEVNAARIPNPNAMKPGTRLIIPARGH
jgi:nucleoid-associated protein YgaU